MQGLIEEGSEILGEEGDDVVKDLALIGAAQKVEHYEIAAYGTARALAESLGMDEVAELLQTTLDEEGATDKALTAVAEELSGNLEEVSDG
jgi:ferritin-like metal-binding protein YciE